MAEDKKFTAEQREFVEAMKKAVLADVEATMGTKAAAQIEKNVNDALEKMKLAEKINELSELSKWKVTATEEIEKYKKNQEWIDKQIAKGEVVEVRPEGNPFKKAMADAMMAAKDKISGYNKTRTALSFELKTVGNIGSGNFSVSGTPAFVHGSALWEPGRKPYEMQHIRDLLRVVPAPDGQDTFVIRDAGGEGGPDTVAPGGTKPQSDRDWVKTIVPYTKIAHYFKVPEEYLQDIAWLQDEIVAVGVEDLLLKEDILLLTNSAVGEFKGLDQTFNSTAFSAPASLAGMFTGSITANNWDVLVAAWTQLRLIPGMATGVLANPADYARMILTKDLNGSYPFGAPNQVIPNLFGAPIVAHTAVTSDKFFVGDFTKVKVAVKNPLTVRFYDQNEDDAIKNLVTILLEERISMAADRADRIIYGDFSDARTALES